VYCRDGYELCWEDGTVILGLAEFITLQLVFWIRGCSGGERKRSQALCDIEQLFIDCMDIKPPCCYLMFCTARRGALCELFDRIRYAELPH
jgi:hypothetical protein